MGLTGELGNLAVFKAAAFPTQPPHCLVATQAARGRADFAHTGPCTRSQDGKGNVQCMDAGKFEVEAQTQFVGLGRLAPQEVYPWSVPHVFTAQAWFPASSGLLRVRTRTFLCAPSGATTVGAIETGEVIVRGKGTSVQCVNEWHVFLVDRDAATAHCKIRRAHRSQAV